MILRNTSTRPRSVPAVALALAAALLIPFVGCIEIGRLLQGNDTASGGRPGPGDAPPVDNRNINDSNTGAYAPPTVHLTASNLAPFLDEQVTLTCSVVDSGGGSVTFSFDPAGILLVDETRGTGTFVVTQSDILNELRFTCSGTNDAGTGPPSDPVSILPIESPQPPPPPGPEPPPDQPPP